MPTVYKGLQSSFLSLAWPWSGRSLPQGQPVGVLGPWTGAQCGWAPSSPATNYLTNLKSDRLTFFTWLVGWPVAADWLAISQNVSLTLPLCKHLVAKCITTVVRCTLRQRDLVAKCDTTSGQVDIWSDLWVRLTFGQMCPHRQRHLVVKCDTTSDQVDLFIGG